MLNGIHDLRSKRARAPVLRSEDVNVFSYESRIPFGFGSGINITMTPSVLCAKGRDLTTEVEPT